jgi:hypothetical protein
MPAGLLPTRISSNDMLSLFESAHTQHRVQMVPQLAEKEWSNSRGLEQQQMHMLCMSFSCLLKAAKTVNLRSLDNTARNSMQQADYTSSNMLQGQFICIAELHFSGNT